MSTITIRSRWWACGITIAMHSLFGAVAIAAGGSPIPPAPEFTSPDIKPTLCDWLTAKPMALAKKLRVTDPLQKPPFAGAPVDSLKGMAAGIRGVQLDAPNRVKAVKYLGSVDCVTYPQAQEMLIATMQEDPSEEVRYEAVMALRAMMSRGCSNMDTSCECESCSLRKKAAKETERHAKQAQRELIKEAKGPAKKLARQVSRDPAEIRYDCCRGCCNDKVLNALAKVAYDKDDQCCWVEPSERVRQAAADGLSLCTVYQAPLSTVAPVPPAIENEGPKEVKPKDEKEVTPELKSTTVPPAPLSALRGTKDRPALAALSGYCIVGLKQRRFEAAREEFSSVFEEHTYYFASRDAKTAFDANPAHYAPAYGGIDPVVWLDRRDLVAGHYLREFDGRFYLFAEKDTWLTFKSSPQRFVLKSTDSSRDLVGR